VITPEGTNNGFKTKRTPLTSRKWCSNEIMFGGAAESRTPVQLELGFRYYSLVFLV